MVKVCVRYFALLREMFGKREEILEVNGKLSDLINILKKRNPKFREFLARSRTILVAVNGELIRGELKNGIFLKNGDVIDLMPPPSGG